MSTFGTTSEAGTSAGGGTDLLTATKYTLTEDGNVTKLSFYSTVAGNIKGALYTDNSGAPDSLIIANNVEVAISANSWVDVSITPTNLTAGVYWIVSKESKDGMRSYKAGGANQLAYKSSVTYADDFPASFGTPSGNQNNDYICYGTYGPPVSSSNSGFFELF